MKRIILEIDNTTASRILKSGNKNLHVKYGNGKIIEIYQPIARLPIVIRELREAVKELNKKGMTSEMLRIYITQKHGVSRQAYDQILKGLSDVINQTEKEYKINKLKE